MAPTAARSTSHENECSRAVKWRDGCGARQGRACSPCQALGADAPDAAADFAAALGVADARIVAPALDAVGRGVAEAHAMKRIGAPVFAHRDWRRGGRREGEAGAVMVSAELSGA